MYENRNLSLAEREAIHYVRGLKAFYSHLATYVIVVGGLALLNLLVSPDYLWFLYGAFGWGVGVVVHGLSTFEQFSFLGSDWERRQIEKRLASRGRPSRQNPAGRP